MQHVSETAIAPEGRDCLQNLSMLLSAHLSTCTAVMSPPGQGEVTGADHTHGGARIRDPYGCLGAQWSTVSIIIQFYLDTKQNTQGLLSLNAHTCTLLCVCEAHPNTDSCIAEAQGFVFEAILPPLEVCQI